MNLLIVDDDPTSLKLLRAQLEAEGHAVFEAHDGVDALALLEHQRVDAVISDILMPRMDGYRLCHEIRKHARLHDLPIILYTSSYTSPNDEEVALDAGANRVLKKPVSIETLVAALHEAITMPHAAPQPKSFQEVEVLKEYSERLVNKLEEKNTELVAAEGKFRALVEQSIVGIYIVQDDQFVYVNPGMQKIFGWSEEEMTSRTVSDFIVPEDHALARENIRKLISGGVPSVRYYLRVLHQSGAVLQVEVHASRTDYNGRPAVMAMQLDITKQRTAQDALIASELRYAAIFEGTAESILIADLATGHFRWVNSAACALLGYTRGELLELTVHDIHPPADLPMVLDRFQAIADGRITMARSVPCQRKDGTILLADVRGSQAVVDGVACNITFFSDVTELRRLEAQLVEATRLEAMGHLAGGVAHDFNNLLTAVNGYADILIRELEGDERVESAREIRRAGARAAELTKQVLAFARRQVLVPRPVDLNAVVASVSQMLRTLIGEQVRLVTNLDSSPAVVLADPGQLEQALVNLAVNSRDAMLGGGVLEIGVRRVEDAVVVDREITGPAVLLTVSDTGVGMDKAILARAFEPFFTTKEVGKGTGLGLATVHGIVRQSGGQIWVESSAGSGTRVSVLFPEVDATPEPTAAPQAVVPEIGEGSCILAVDDDAAVRAFVVATLERAGYRVLVAASPAQAAVLSEGLAETVDLLLTDLVMPGENGRDLAERLLVSRRSLRVVLMSGYDVAPPEDRHDDRFTFLAKPFGADELVAAVRQALAEPEA